MLAIPNTLNNAISCHDVKNTHTTPKQLRNLNLSVSFGYDSPLKDVAKVCAYCGREMLTEVEVNQMVDKLQRSEGTELQKQLNEVIQKLRIEKTNGIHAHILSEIKELSISYPFENGKDLARLYIKEINNDFEEDIKATEAQKEEVFNQLLQLRPLVPEYTKKLIDDFIALKPSLLVTRLNAVDLIKRKSIAAGLTLPKDFLEYCDKIFPETQRLKAKGHILKIKDYSPREFYYQLLNPIKITMEHIHPHSKKHTNADLPVDDTFNYLPVCSECNGKREDIDFIEQVNKNPGIAEFIKRSLQQVKNAIASIPNPASELKEYIARVCVTLKRESHGTIDLRV